MNQPVGHIAFSELIGTIYDCAIQPELWPVALERICSLIGGTLGTLSILDAEDKSIKFAWQWGGDPYWLDLLFKRYASQMPFFLTLPLLKTGEVINTQHLVDLTGDRSALDGPFFREWAQPAGYRDVAGVVLHRSATRFSLMTVQTPFSRDVVSKTDIDRIESVVPHVRRALKISDALGMQTVTAQTFERTMERLNTPLILVDAESRVIYANPSAKGLLADGAILSVAHGRLNAHSPEQLHQLCSAVTRCTTVAESDLEGGTTVRLTSQTQSTAVAHVLPISPANAGMVTKPVRVCAVIVVGASVSPPPAIETIIDLFNLTQTEARVALAVLEGMSRAEIAEAMSIADSTVKTHMSRILQKSGTRDREELAQVLARFSPPAR